jgi:hypothetical protein
VTKEAQPYNDTQLTNMGMALIEAGQYEQAFAFFKRELLSDTESYQAHINYGLALTR